MAIGCNFSTDFIMIRLIRLVAKIVLISIGLGIGAKLISMGFIMDEGYARTGYNRDYAEFIVEFYSNRIGVGVAIISTIIFTIKPTLLGPLYKKNPDDQE